MALHLCVARVSRHTYKLRYVASLHIGQKNFSKNNLRMKLIYFTLAQFAKIKSQITFVTMKILVTLYFSRIFFSNFDICLSKKKMGNGNKWAALDCLTPFMNGSVLNGRKTVTSMRRCKIRMSLLYFHS